MKSTGLSNNNIELQPRKPYIKPMVERVRLVIEETVLALCKTEFGDGPNSSPCGWIEDPCGSPGS